MIEAEDSEARASSAQARLHLKGRRQALFSLGTIQRRALWLAYSLLHQNANCFLGFKFLFVLPQLHLQSCKIQNFIWPPPSSLRLYRKIGSQYILGTDDQGQRASLRAVYSRTARTCMSLCAQLTSRLGSLFLRMLTESFRLRRRHQAPFLASAGGPAKHSDATRWDGPLPRLHWKL